MINNLGPGGEDWDGVSGEGVREIVEMGDYKKEKRFHNVGKGLQFSPFYGSIKRMMCFPFFKLSLIVPRFISNLKKLSLATHKNGYVATTSIYLFDYVIGGNLFCKCDTVKFSF